MAANDTLLDVIQDSGLKKQAIGQRLGIAPWRFSKIIHGVLRPTPEEKRAIARLLKRPVRELFPEAV